MTQQDNTSFIDPIIHYSQCWEDPRTLVQALGITPSDDVLSIASGGENTFALLLQNPHSVTAIDRNPAQVYLVELKMRAIQALNYDDFVAFVGACESNTRDRQYAFIRHLLSKNARRYWDERIDEIRQGVIHCGKFEKYFSLFRRCVLPFIHGRKDVERLLRGESLDVQQSFYDEVWNNTRWRWFFRIFFGKFLLGRRGRDPSLFRYVKIENVADELLERTQHGLTEIPIIDNFFVEYILTGKYHDLENSHPYLSERNFHILRERVGEIRLVIQSLDEYLQFLPHGSLSKFNLSDIFEYMSETEFENALRVIQRASREDGRLAFWTLFVPRKIFSLQTNTMKSHSEIAEQLFASDRTFFYGGFGVWGINEASSRNSPRLETVACSSKGIAS